MCFTWPSFQVIGRTYWAKGREKQTEGERLWVWDIWITNTALLMETHFQRRKSSRTSTPAQTIWRTTQLLWGSVSFPLQQRDNEPECHNWQKPPEDDHRSACWAKVDLLTRSSDSWRPSFCRTKALVWVMSRETCRSNRNSSRPLTMAEEVHAQNPTRLPYILMATINWPIGSKKRSPLLYDTLGEIRNTEAGKSTMTQQHDGLHGATCVCLHIGNNPIYNDFHRTSKNGEASQKQATQQDKVTLRHNNNFMRWMVSFQTIKNMRDSCGGMGHPQRPSYTQNLLFSFFFYL